jgi:hypothetical protein
MLWKAWSPVAHRSNHGHSAAPVKMRASGKANGMNTLSDRVCPRKLISQAGMMRSEPSRIPMYQSGWEADEIASGVYGPYSQIGLTWANVESSVSAAKMKKNQAWPLTRKYG